MTATADPFVAQRPVLLDGLRRAVENVAATHGALLREQLAALDANDPAFDPALLCLLTTETLGGRLRDALPAATSLALLALMGRAFEDIAPDEERGLAGAWGVPRALNAGDAFYALAQSTLLDGFKNDPARGRAAIDLLDIANRAHSEALHAALTAAARSQAGRALLPAALNLGALVAGIDADLSALADASATQVRGVSSEAAARLAGAARYISSAR